MPTLLFAENDRHASAVLETADGTVCLPSRGLGHVCRVCFDALIPGRSHFRGNQRLHTLAEASAERPVLCVHSKWIDPKCGFLLVHSSKLILCCSSLKRPSSSRPNTSTSIRNAWLLKEYKVLLSILWKQIGVRCTEWGCIGISVWHGTTLSEKTSHMVSFENLHPQAILIPAGRCKDL